MSFAGGSHKPSHHIERRFFRGEGGRARMLEPGQRVIVRSEPGVPNPYDGRMGAVVGVEGPEGAVGGEAVYSVLLDFALPGEEPGVPVPVFAGEVVPTNVPKDESLSVSSAERPNRRLAF